MNTNFEPAQYLQGNLSGRSEVTMSNPWKKISLPVEAQNLNDIMSEEFAKGLQTKEDLKFAEVISDEFVIIESGEPCDAPDVTAVTSSDQEESTSGCDSDAVIAKLLQCQFDKEYDDELKVVEKKLNGDSKISVSYDNYRNVPQHLAYDSESEEEDVETAEKKDWDRFETNAKEYASLPKRGFIVKDGVKVTKHDSVINGRRNACRVMEFPPNVCTGDGAKFDMILSNSVFNNLREQTRPSQARKHKNIVDKKDSRATVDMAFDEATKVILMKLINKGLLMDVDGIISTGKESVVLHGDCDQTYTEIDLPKECAIKIHRTTLSEFKTRLKYIEGDSRYRDRLAGQNPRKIIQMWAEKEMRNMKRMKKIGLNCPEVFALKEHVLVMSFIGNERAAAPKLKDVSVKEKKWETIYNEVLDAMYKLYNDARLIHADLSEYNILWWENKCWFIDVSQAVEPDHPSALEFLLRDCLNICLFFEKKGVTNLKSSKEMFMHITGLDNVDPNMLDGVMTMYNADSIRVFRPPTCCVHHITLYNMKKEEIETNGEKGEDIFDEMWERSQSDKLDLANSFGVEIDNFKGRPTVTKNNYYYFDRCN